MLFRSVSLITGLSIEEINELPLWKLEFYFRQIAILRNSQPSKKLHKTIWLNGRMLKAITSDKDLNTNQYITAKHLQNNEVSSYPFLCAVIYCPAKLFSQPKFDSKLFEVIAKDFESVKVGKVYGALFFCIKLLNNLKRQQELLLSNQAKTIIRILREEQVRLMDSGQDMDGTLSQIVSRVETSFMRMN